VRTNKIPRQIPEQPWYMNPLFSCLVGGVLPFGAVFIELFFILTSMWLHQFYYLFGFLALVFVILIITCAEITIVLCYFQLCSEDYHWWWRAYCTSGASALYLLAYSVFYFYSKLDITKKVRSRAQGPRGCAEGTVEQSARSAPLSGGGSRGCLPGRCCDSSTPSLTGADAYVLWLHDHHILRLLLPHGHHRLLCLLLVRAQDLRRHQDCGWPACLLRLACSCLRPALR
jgi:hypothetical protein